MEREIEFKELWTFLQKNGRLPNLNQELSSHLEIRKEWSQTETTIQTNSMRSSKVIVSKDENFEEKTQGWSNSFKFTKQTVVVT